MIIVDEKTFNLLMSQAVEPEQAMLNDKYDCKDAVDDDDETCVTGKRIHGQKKKRENSWVRNHHYKGNFMRKFYQGVNPDNFTCASRTVRNYLVYDLDKPSKFFRIEGQYNSCFFSGPKYKKEKKRRTSRILRHCTDEDFVHASGAWYKRLCYEDPEYSNKF